MRNHLFTKKSLIWAAKVFTSKFSSFIGSIQSIDFNLIRNRQIRVHRIRRCYRISSFEWIRPSVQWQKWIEVVTKLGTSLEFCSFSKCARFCRQSWQSTYRWQRYSHIQITATLRYGYGIHVGANIRHTACDELIRIRLNGPRWIWRVQTHTKTCNTKSSE